MMIESTERKPQLLQFTAGLAAALVTAIILFWWIMINAFNAIQPWDNSLPLPDAAAWQYQLYDLVSDQGLLLGGTLASIIVGICLMILIRRLSKPHMMQEKAAKLYTFSMLNLFFVAVSFVVFVILVEMQRFISTSNQQSTYIDALPFTLLFSISLLLLLLLHLKVDSVASLGESS